MFHALVQCIVALSKTRSVLIILEDLHWAGSATTAFLDYFAQTIGRYPVMMIGTYREEEADRSHPLRSLRRNLQRKNQLVHLALGRLEETGVHTILERLSGSKSIARSLANNLWLESEGNPLFLKERLRDLLKSQQIQLDNGEWHIDSSQAASLPGGIQAIIANRLRRLSAEAYNLAEIAATIGFDFDVELLSEVIGGSESEIYRGLEELLDSQLVREITGQHGYDYQFTHHLIQKTIYSQVDEERLRRRHHRIGSVMEEIYGQQVHELAAELALHFDRGGDQDRAISYYLMTAQRAEAMLAYEEALAVLGRGIELASPQGNWAPERLALLRLRQRILGSLMRLAEWRADLAEMEELALRLEDFTALLEALEARVWLYGYEADWAQMELTSLAP